MKASSHPTAILYPSVDPAEIQFANGRTAEFERHEKEL